MELSRVLTPQPLTLSQSQLVELIHRLLATVKEILGCGGYSLSSSGMALEQSITRYTLTGCSGDPGSDLLVVRDSNRVTLIEVANSEIAQESPWATALEESLLQLQGPRSLFAWTAVIGPIPSRDQGIGLTHPFVTSEIVLTPQPRPYLEFLREPGSPYRIASGGTLAYSWPVVVSGESEGFAWPGSADREAARRLHVVCALLSLAWDSAWIVREEILPRDENLDRLSGRWTLPDGPASPVFANALPDLRIRALEPPNWLSLAIPAVECATALRDALGIFYQGVQLEDDHPSIALLAFIATVEVISDLRKGQERCRCCGQVTGSAAKFRETIAEVLEPAAATLVSTAYGQRSKTAHGGTLFGEEWQQGSHLHPMDYGPIPEFDFRYSTLRYARVASRKLVLRELLRTVGKAESESVE